MTRSIKRILMCSMAVPWPSKPTLCAFHHDQAKALAEFGTEMRLFSPAPKLPSMLRFLSSRFRGQIERPESYELNDVQTESPRVLFAFPPLLRHRLAAMRPDLVAAMARRAMRKSLRKVIQDYRPDLLLGHGIMPMGRTLQEAASEHDLPYSIIEHSAGDVMRLETGSKLEQHYKSVADAAEKVFVVGSWMEMHLKGLGWNNISMLPNGTSYPDDVQLRRPRPEDLKGRSIVVSAAHYDRRKGFEELVSAFTRISTKHLDAMLVVISNASEGLRNQIQTAGLGDRIRLLPLMSKDALKQWMVWADLFAMPSWSEAFGLVYIEAMTCQSPVIMTGDCGLAPQLGLVVTEPMAQQHGWIVEPGSVDSMVVALDDALSDPARLRRMGESGQAFVGERFTWRENARQLLAALGVHEPRFEWTPEPGPEELETQFGDGCEHSAQPVHPGQST